LKINTNNRSIKKETIAMENTTKYSAIYVEI